MEREENDGVRSIERGGHPRMRDWRGRNIDGGRSIEGLEREENDAVRSIDRREHLRMRD